METGNLKVFNLRLRDEEHEALQIYAAITGRSMHDVAVQALREFLAGPGRAEQLEKVVSDAQARYRVVLDKLKE